MLHYNLSLQAQSSRDHDLGRIHLYAGIQTFQIIVTLNEWLRAINFLPNPFLDIYKLVVFYIPPHDFILYIELVQILTI